MKPPKLLLRAFAVALAYAAVGLVALQMQGSQVQGSALFPAAGIALAAVAVYGVRMLPAVWLGSVLTHVAAHGLAGTLTPQILAIIGVVALGSAAQALLGACLTCPNRPQLPPLDTPRSFARFAILGALMASLVSASVATGTFWSTGLLATADVPHTWWTWWSGDAIGVLIGVPVTFALIASPRSVWAPRRLAVAVPVILLAVFLALLLTHLTQSENERNAAAFQHDAARAAPPNLVLLDLNLPDISGLEVLAAIKADPRLASVPVIVVTADAMPDQVLQAKRAGAAGYLTKPLRADDVLACVDAALRSRHAA